MCLMHVQGVPRGFARRDLYRDKADNRILLSFIFFIHGLQQLTQIHVLIELHFFTEMFEKTSIFIFLSKKMNLPIS